MLPGKKLIVPIFCSFFLPRRDSCLRSSVELTNYDGTLDGVDGLDQINANL